LVFAFFNAGHSRGSEFEQCDDENGCAFGLVDFDLARRVQKDCRTLSPVTI